VNIVDCFKPFPWDPNRSPGLNDGFVVPEQHISVFAKWFWRVRAWTVTDNLATPPTIVLVDGQTLAGADGIGGGLQVAQTTTALGAVTLETEMDLYEKRHAFGYYATDGVISQIQLWLLHCIPAFVGNTGPGARLTEDDKMRGTGRMELAYTRDSGGGLDAYTVSSEPGGDYPCTIMVDGVAVIGSVLVPAGVMSDPGMVVTLTPTEFWPYGTEGAPVYDTATGDML
jgi:hypothetical protein